MCVCACVFFCHSQTELTFCILTNSLISIEYRQKSVQFDSFEAYTIQASKHFNSIIRSDTHEAKYKTSSVCVVLAFFVCLFVCLHLLHVIDSTFFANVDWQFCIIYFETVCFFCDRLKKTTTTTQLSVSMMIFDLTVNDLITRSDWCSELIYQFSDETRHIFSRVRLIWM